jgi:hypothetical protein
MIIPFCLRFTIFSLLSITPPPQEMALLLDLEYLTDKISTVFINSEKSWNFDITPTSIYNFYSSEPEIARSIKNIFSIVSSA